MVVNDPDALYVAAAWGAEAQWLENVEADPRVIVHLGSKRFRTKAELVAEDDARDLMHRYGEAHRWTLDRLARFMLDDPGDTGEEKAGRIAETTPMVRLS